MKILIAVLSCLAHRPFQQAQRETWVKDIPADVDFRYFVGHSDDLAGDEVFLEVEDKIVPEAGLKLYPSLPRKTKALCAWALDHGYEYMFKTDTDTLVNVSNLLRSGFQTSEYSGGYNHETAGLFASGGAGYWLSAKAMRVVVESTREYWAEDVFVAIALRDKFIFPVWHPGYKWKPKEVLDRDTFTLHLSSVLQRGPYDPAWMYEHYEKMKAL